MDLVPTRSPGLSPLGLGFPSVKRVAGFLKVAKWDQRTSWAPVLDTSLTPSVPRLILGMMVTTSFLSMWLSNTASTAMMLPIASAVLKSLFGQETRKDLGQQSEENAGEAVERHRGSPPTQHARVGAGCPKVAGEGEANALAEHILCAECLHNNSN